MDSGCLTPSAVVSSVFCRPHGTAAVLLENSDARGDLLPGDDSLAESGNE